MCATLFTAQKGYLDSIQSVKPTNGGRWKILILDKHSQALINSLLKTFEILELNVQQVDLIEKDRNPSPNLEAIYILAPTAKNIDRIISDFSPKSGRGTAPTSSGPRYAAAHMFFIDGTLSLDDLLVERLTSSPASPYLRQLIEIFTNISADEPNVYTLRPRNPRSLLTLYAPPQRSPRESLESWEDEIGWISKSLINLFATLGEKPYIRFYNPPNTTPLGPAAAAKEHLCKRLATCLQKDLDDYCDSNEGFPPIADPPRPRGTMFITERSMDLYAPLLHEFTYQAMCNDLLEIKDGNKYSYTFKDQSGDSETKEMILGEEDKVWVEVRHMHMKDALDKLIQDFKNYASEHGNLTNGSSLNDMKDMLASLPHLKESKEKLSLHLSLAETCMELFEKQQLSAVASVEQCCATGMTAEGRNPKSLVEEMVPLLDDRSVSTTNKLRIIALYVLYRDGVPDEDRRRLYQHAKLGLSEMDAVNNLIYLGADKPLFKQSVNENDYDISRFQPFVNLMLQDAISNKLDLNTFPYIGETPFSNPQNGGGNAGSGTSALPTSLRSAKPSWQRPKAKGASDNRQRLMVFVAGGMTHSEIRTAYTISEAHSKDVVIGSTHIYTPKTFIEDLSLMDRGGASGSSKPPPPSEVYNAKPAKTSPRKPPEPRNRLQAYDDRYAKPPTPPSQKLRPPDLPSPASRGPSSGSYRDQPPSGSGYALRAQGNGGQSPMMSPSAASSVSGSGKEKKKGFFSRSKK
ncbi:Sec1-like protein [Phakopsora pachyrhizi]|nr:Sec1-like protein [Phakopsora pachyrhizi]